MSLKSDHVVKHQEEGVCVRTLKPGVFGSIIWTRNNFTSNKYNCSKYEVENSNLEHMRVQYTKANVLLPVSSQFLLAHSIQVVSSSRGIKKELWERTLRTDVYYLMLTTENQCGTLVFHRGEFEHYWNLSNQLLFTSAKTGLYTLTYSTFQSHVTSGRTVTRAQAPTVRCAFHPWKMGFFIFF